MIELDMRQGSHEWHLARHGKVTGTRFKSATGSPAVQKTLLNELVAERMTEVVINDIGTRAVERGKEIEPFGRVAVAEELGVELEEVGMLLAENLDNFGVSPDAVIRNGDGVIVGGLEIKCPDSKKHVEYLLGGVVPKEYWDQVLAPFAVDESIEYWYFASYDDRNYERPLFLVRVDRADIQAELDAAVLKLVEFLDKVHSAHVGLTF